MAAIQVSTGQPAEQPRYPPIGDYGLIGDGRSCALISCTGSIDWWCLPRFDGDPIFARLLDADRGGFFRVQPRDSFQTTRSYVAGTNILATEFTTSTGAIRVLDFMPALTEAQKRRYPIPFREIVRRVEALSGRVTLTIQLRVRPQFGRRTPAVRRQRADCHVIEWSNQALHLISSVPLAVEASMLQATVDIAGGERIDLALAYSQEAPADLPTLGSLDLIQRLTEEFWNGWSGVCRYTGAYQEAVRRSALMLKLLTYAPSGAIIAAPTTSLPEQIGGQRNWDYRYCWLRDAAFTIRVLLSLGYQNEADAFAGWLLHATRLTHPELRALYTVHGESRLSERTIDDMEGYRGSRPVRVGNAATAQFQLDVYGEVIDALALYRRSGGRLDRDARRLIAGMADLIMRRWQEPDEGIWEVRAKRAQHVHSKIMACVGLERVLELAGRNDVRVATDRVAAARDAIRAWVLDHGYDRALGSFTRTPGQGLDAALLVIPLVDFLDAHDPRVAGTVAAVQRQLARGELVYRYRDGDGLAGDEGAFVICSFWLVEALARLGRRDEAQELFERLLARRNDLGLLAEEIDPESGEQLGNFPQAFSHIGLINAALTLAEVGERS